MTRRVLAHWLAWVLLPIWAGSAAAETAVTPSLALRSTTLLLHSRANLAGLPTGWFGQAGFNVRPGLDLDFEHGRASLELEAQGLLASQAGAAAGTSLLGTARPMRLVFLGWRAIDDTTTHANGQIDRADLLLYLGSLDLQLGRQPLNLGSSHLLGVLDVIAPFAPGALDTSFKPGVDALRLRGGLGSGAGAVGEWELIAVGAAPLKQHALLARVRLTISQFDLEWTGGRFRQRGFGGFGWEGEFAELGFWGEAALFQRRSEATLRGLGRVAFSAASGLEGTLPGELLVGASLLYQDFGAGRPAELTAVYAGEPVQQGWQFLGSAAYAALTAKRDLTSLASASGMALINLVDGSTLWQPQVSLSTGNESDLTFFAWLASGRTPTSVAGLPHLRSEFGTAPSGAGIYARWFF